MKIIPVLDLMGGVVVRGVQGHRATYQPVESVLTESCDALAVARALWQETACEALYIADLDAIEGRGTHWATVQELSAQIPVHLWIDAGITDTDQIPRWLDAGVDRMVVGSETMDSLHNLNAIRAAAPTDRLVFSLDMQRGMILSRSQELRALTPISLLEWLAARGWTHVILLALDRVGTGDGPDWSLLDKARRGVPDLALIVGGGVRGLEDLHRLAELGAHGVLVASALHDGWLTTGELHLLTTEPEDRERSPDPDPRSRTQRG
jgi:phosphoribosylformimino-5-aminoimidazole carboxamide ribotide isomerase